LATSPVPINRAAHRLDETHPGFIDRHERSEYARWRIGEWLGRRGHDITMLHQDPPNPDWRIAIHEPDRGDIWLKSGGVNFRIEVKWLEYPFTSARDWKFPTFIVCRQGSFDDAQPKPYAYIHVSAQLKHVAVTRVSTTRDRWFVRDATDRERGITTPQYHCPIELLRFLPLEGPSSRQIDPVILL
jgi:hypothetical protein